MAAISCSSLVSKSINDIAEELKFLGDALTASQQASFDKVISLFEEEKKGFQNSSGSVKSRRKAACNLVRMILNELNVEIFSLCIVTLSVTRLASINATSFKDELQKWYRNNQLPENFCTLVKEKLEACILSAVGKRKNSDVEQGSPNKRRAIGGIIRNDEHRSNEEGQGTFPYIGSMPIGIHISNLDTAATTDDDSDDGGFVQERQIADGPFQGQVYLLKPLDVLRTVILSEKFEFLLTMPDHQGTQPFIMVPCPEELARTFLAKRDKIM
ncbi:Endosomal peripheral membrane protein [Apiospora arundinis]